MTRYRSYLVGPHPSIEQFELALSKESPPAVVLPDWVRSFEPEPPPPWANTPESAVQRTLPEPPYLPQILEREEWERMVARERRKQSRRELEEWLHPAPQLGPWPLRKFRVPLGQHTGGASRFQLADIGQLRDRVPIDFTDDVVAETPALRFHSGAELGRLAPTFLGPDNRDVVLPPIQCCNGRNVARTSWNQAYNGCSSCRGKRSRLRGAQWLHKREALTGN